MDPTARTALIDLVRRAQKGDEGALRELIVSYQRRVSGFVFTMTNRVDYVEDLSQQVFIKMVRALDRLREPEWFESWLFRLARNMCFDHLRLQKHRCIFLPFWDQCENIPEPPGDVHSEELDALRHALAKLRPEDRALPVLVVEGHRYAEIAKTTETSIASVKSRVYRARENLSMHYQPANPKHGSRGGGNREPPLNRPTLLRNTIPIA